MQEYSLPEEIRGEWIWRRDCLDELDSFVFFRKEFTLSETPASAELWLAARTRCHVYINGRYLGFGPPPCPSEDAYVMYFDLGFLCETGNNTIAILGHNVGVSRYAARRHQAGLWCQVNIDGGPTVWSDQTWVCLPGDCYEERRPRASVARGFCEKLDSREFPTGWEDKEYSAKHWDHPDHALSLGRARGQLTPLPSIEWNVERYPFVSATVPGAFSHAMATSHVSFADVAEERGEGVYAAEAFVFCDNQPEAALSFEVYADDPYCLLVNGEIVKQQGVAPLPPKADLGKTRPPCHRQGAVEQPDVQARLQEGWNSFVLVQQADRDSSGVTMVFPDLVPDDLHLVRRESDDATLGWSIAGPIRVPLPLVSGTLDLSSLPKTVFVPTDEEPIDESAHLMAFVFEGDGQFGEALDVTPLQQGEYVILDLERFLYGCPELTVTGEEGDILDIVCGEQIIQSQLLPYLAGQRNVDTIILREGTFTWMPIAPRGMRYVMILARRCASTMLVENCGVLCREYTFDTTGSFTCSDEVLNSIWQTSGDTLKATLQERFMDSPTRGSAQYISDAMIQSWAAYHASGAFSLAAKSIREFARAQFETGEMPSMGPSDIYVHTPDISLLWPVWLQRHYLYTGDRQFLESCAPALEGLFAYYADVAAPTGELLEDLGGKLGAYCFLDHGSMDREGIVTGLNAIYCRALLSGAWLFKELDQQEMGHLLRTRASAIMRKLRQLAWDEERGLFADGWQNGDMSEFYSWQTNVLAIYGGIAEASSCNAIFDKLFTKEPPYELFASGETNNPYFKYFVLEVAFALERREWGINLLRWYWGGMLERGAKAWWELFDPEGNPDEFCDFSLCHGYGTSPMGFLPTELAGIRPATPGFTTAYFNPLPGIVDWVKCHTPTPYGRITAEWRIEADGTFEAVIDANYPLDVVPVLSPGLAETAVIHVSDSVNILAAPPA